MRGIIFWRFVVEHTYTHFDTIEQQRSGRISDERVIKFISNSPFEKRSESKMYLYAPFLFPLANVKKYFWRTKN